MGLLQRSLTARLLVYFLLLTIVPLGLIGYVAYESGRQSIENQVKAHLNSVATLKEQEIHNWMEHLQHTMTWMASSPAVIEDAAALIHSSEDDSRYADAHESLNSEFQRTAAIGHLSPIFLLDRINGRIIASSDPTWEGKFRENEPYFIRGKGDNYISDIFHSLTMGRPTMVVSIPVRDTEGQLLGVLAGHANLERLSSLIMERSGLGKTGETFLVNKSNLLITNTVFAPEGAFKKWVFGEGAMWALEGKRGVDLFLDYRDEPVIGAYRWMENRQLALIAKQDQAEAFVPVNDLRNTIIIVAGLLFFIAGAVGMLASRQITGPLYSLARYARRVGMGDYKAEVEISGRDEVASVASDVKKIMGQLLAVQEQLLLTDNAVRSSLSGIAIADMEGNLIYVNPAFLKMWGYDKAEEVMGKPATSFWKKPEEALKTLQVMLSGEKVEETELVAKRKGGTEFATEVRANPIINAEGQPVAMAASFIDITERTRMQDQLRTSERLATLGQFSGSISHELRNPLGVVDSSVYYLKKKLKDADEKVQEHLERIKSGVGSSTAIIESLLNLTRMKEPELSRLDLAAITSDAIATSKVLAKVKVTRNFPEQEVPVNGDGEQLRMAFKNIIKNAVEAMDGKGTLKITVGTDADGQAEISFTDNGPGIAQEDLGRVFQPLFSTKAKGIGFGLSIAKMVVDKHGGTIKAESKPRKGATIVTKFPLYVEKTKEA